MVELTIKLILNIFIFVTVVVIPFIYVLYSHKFWRGVFLVWGLMIFTSFIITVPVFAIVYHYNKELAVACFPEAIVMTPIIVFGWIWGLIISAIAIFIRFLVKRYYPVNNPTVVGRSSK